MNDRIFCCPENFHFIRIACVILLRRKQHRAQNWTLPSNSRCSTHAVVMAATTAATAAAELLLLLLPRPPLCYCCCAATAALLRRCAACWIEMPTGLCLCSKLAKTRAGICMLTGGVKPSLACGHRLYENVVRSRCFSGGGILLHAHVVGFGLKNECKQQCAFKFYIGYQATTIALAI